MDSSPTSQWDQNHHGARLAITPNCHPSSSTPPIQEYIYTSHIACAHTHVNQVPIVSLWTSDTCQEESLFPFPLICSPSPLILHSWGDTWHWSLEKAQGQTRGTDVKREACFSIQYHSFSATLSQFHSWDVFLKMHIVTDSCSQQYNLSMVHSCGGVVERLNLKGVSQYSNLILLHFQVSK